MKFVWMERIWRGGPGIHTGREYWMIHRGTGFLAVVWFGFSPTHSPLLPPLTQEDFEKIDTCAQNYRPCFRENQPKSSFSIKWKRAFWACFRENWVYKFGHWLTGDGGKGVSQKPIIRPKESLVLYKPFNTVCTRVYCVNMTQQFVHPRLLREARTPYACCLIAKTGS